MDARAGSLWHKIAGEAVPRNSPRHGGGPLLCLAVVETSRVRGTAAVRTESSGRGQAPHVPGAAGGEGREHWRSSRELGGAGQGSQNRQPDDAKSLKYKYSLSDGKTV